jgi:hypothetical protein
MYDFAEFYNCRKFIDNNFKGIKDMPKVAEIMMGDKN